MNRIADPTDPASRTPLHRRRSDRVLDSLLLYYHNREEQSEPELLLVILDDAELPASDFLDQGVSVQKIDSLDGLMN